MFQRILSELRHRKVLKTAVAYAIFVAASVEFIDIATPTLGLPEGLLHGVITVALFGFPVVMVLSWFYDFTSGGIVKGTAPEHSSPSQTSHLFSMILIGLLVTAVAYLSYRLNWMTQGPLEFERGKSIAVLPFSSISAESESDNGYFSRGISEEILNALSKVEGLRVTQWNSSFAFEQSDTKETGKALNVSVVLQGTVRRSGNQLRISAQLIDTSDGFQIWSDVYNHELDNVFLIQEQIARAIVNSLQIELLGETGERLVRTGTNNPIAYDKYLEGRDALKIRTPLSARHAIAVFEQALEIDPDYAQAYAGLADSWILLREVGNLTLFKATQRSHEAISKSLRLNNQLPEAQASLGLCILGGGSRIEAERQFLKAIDLDPEYSDAYLFQANLLRDRGLLTKATGVYTKAISLDPYNKAILENQALLFANQGRFDEAIEQLTTQSPKSEISLTENLALSQVWALAGNNQKALHHAQQAVSSAPESPVAMALLLESHVRLGNLEQAAIVLANLRESAPENETAIIATMRYYLMTGDYNKLDQLATSRLAGIIEEPGFAGTEILFERTGWGSIALLHLNDPQKAQELLEKGLPPIEKLEPNPESIYKLVLLAQARKLNGDLEGTEVIASNAERLIERAQKEGWGGSKLDYLRATVAAARNQNSLALEHLTKAISAGWNDFVFVEHDPIMLDIIKLAEFKKLNE